MAHTYGNASTLTSSTGNPIRHSTYTPVAGSTVIVLFLKPRGAVDRAGGAPTINGLVMQQANTVQKAAVSPEVSVELWYLTNPTFSGNSVNLMVPNTGGITVYYQLASGKAAPGLRSEFFMAVGANNTSTNPSPGTLSVPTNGIGFAVVGSGAQTWAPSSQTGTVISNVDHGNDGEGTQYRLDAGQLDWTFGTSEDWGAIAASFQEVPGITLNNYNCGIKAGAGISVGERIR